MEQRGIGFLAVVGLLAGAASCSETTLEVENATGIAITVAVSAKSGTDSEGPGLSMTTHSLAKDETASIPLQLSTGDTTTSVKVMAFGEFLKVTEQIEVTVGEVNPKRYEANAGIIEFKNDGEAPVSSFCVAVIEDEELGELGDCGIPYGPLEPGGTQRVGPLVAGDGYWVKQDAAVSGPIEVTAGQVTPRSIEAQAEVKAEAPPVVAATSKLKKKRKRKKRKR